MSTSKSIESSLAECVRALSRDAQANRAVPCDVADYAARATRTRLAELAVAPLGRSERARISSYFWAVVRRRSARSAGARAYARAMVRASVEQDLRQAGWDAFAIARELEESPC